MSNTAKNFDILATGLSVLHNYFDSSTKLLYFDLYPAKILDLLAKLFFSCIVTKQSLLILILVASIPISYFE